MEDEGGFVHRSVLMDEVLELLAPVPTGLLLDATLGAAGHAEALLEARSDLRLLGVDRDPDALAFAAERLARFGDRVRLEHANFAQVGELLADLDEPLVGALFDLGVSSPQIDRPERGFSYRHTGPLDMRMDPTQPLTAEVIVNTYPVDRLTRILADRGDVPAARRVASEIVARRPLETTDDLVEATQAGTPAAVRRRGNPAKRVFQGIRMEVNDEVESLIDALDQTIDRLVLGGRVAVLSYHSGEDRVVKERFRRADRGGCSCPSAYPCVCGATPEGRLITRKPIGASAAETTENRRAASVRLRVLEKGQMAS
ncbi:MAG: 16S rRNA (cytosine(1402)-N(4))-methyltransferase RsmH [Microthrixaceae bacterium]